MTAAIIVRNGRVLLVKNAKEGVRIEPPGGKKGPDESWEESVVREVMEELGVVVRVKELFGVYRTHSPEGDFRVRMYLCEIVEGEPRVCEPDKVPSFGWYDYDGLVRLREDGVLVPNMVDAMEDIKTFLNRR